METMARVLIIVQNLPVPLDRRVWLEATTLARAGYGVSIICPMGKTKYRAGHEKLEDIDIYRYPAPPEADSVPGYLFEFVYCWLMTAFLSLQVWLTRGFDVIQACNPPETYFVLASAYKLLGKRFIFDHHDLSPEMYEAKGGKKGGLLCRLLLLFERLTFQTADVVMTTNESYKQVALERGGVPAERIFVVRSGPDLERLQLMAPEVELKQGRPYLGCYLGEMCRQDGIEYLLHAIKYIVQDLGRRDVTFVLMGGGPDHEHLRQLTRAMGLEEQVTFTGRVTDRDLCRYLSTADVCFDPDPYSEWADRSTMNKIMEYMYFAKPIVAFDLKENRFSAGDAAIYARPNHVEEFAMIAMRLLGDTDRRRGMGQRGRERVQTKLAWEYSKPALLAAYMAVLNRPQCQWMHKRISTARENQ